MGHRDSVLVQEVIADAIPWHWIKDRQIALLGETPVPLGRDNHFVLIQDPDGTFIELIGPMK